MTMLIVSLLGGAPTLTHSRGDVGLGIAKLLTCGGLGMDDRRLAFGLPESHVKELQRFSCTYVNINMNHFDLKIH